ncbi:collagenase [Chromobacterium violaceum]|uniref:M9 family metallopeptidase n=1 Tax=Chromobacterium violaceum TaxID=536 RepID=UPI0009D985A9|nr:M9 family metallopeptidase [Chromobacterium violaceum]OQS10792.1 collagenase [Chromobacterium violaceum]OQS27221.1 collagenase [Chromobacterium violaceum]OQS46105.1 collagenase [Chromobacterium violaceum]OQS52236.1 collagenase [Chromobacterium violaceum]
MRSLPLAALCLALAAALSAPAHAAPKTYKMPHQAKTQAKPRQPAPPRLWRQRPPTDFQARYRLQDNRTVIGRPLKKLIRHTATPQCQDMNAMAGHSGTDLANYLASLPDYTCTYGLFALDKTLASAIYTPANLNAVAGRFAQEAAAYNASSMTLVNLTLYLRAGYYLASTGTLPALDANLQAVLRPGIKQLADGAALFAANAQAPTTAHEVMTLITNMADEAYYLPSIRTIVQRYTNTAANPNAAQALRETTASQGFTGALTVFFYAHGRANAAPLLQNDGSYSAALTQFVQADKAGLLGTETAYQLGDATREGLRFMQYPALKPAIKPQAKAILAGSSMTGADNELWLAAAEAVKYYDNDNCAEYGTCGFETRLADAILVNRYTCSPTIHIRAQEMTTDQMQSSCALLQKEESYFHQMLQTRNQPVANDNSTSLEVVVFDDYNNYSKYAGVIYGISTDNGGMYLEGNPADPNNQARFIAHEASWLRPVFKVWNLEHEYIHYLDGRFDMYGDFAAATQQPTVWWIEGLAEYLSLRNDNQTAIDVAKTGNYKLSQIFGNTYDMPDYVTRAYRWGYMATRFMFERHRADVDAMLPLFRKGDYAGGYMGMMRQIGSRYDGEFASWAQSATTAGQPPLPPSTGLPACNEGYPERLGKNCSISGLSSSSAAYATIWVPAGARNLKLWTSGGSGDVDLYVAKDRYPTPASYDYASAASGNEESVAIAAPQAGHWYYLTLQAKQPFANVAVSASYE